MNCRGQALVETVGLLLVYGVLLSSFAGFTKWFLIRQKLLMAAREAAFLYSSGHFDVDAVRNRVVHYLATGSPTLVGRNVRIVIGGARDKRAKAFHLDEVRIRYQPTSELVRLIQPTMEETCIIKHAPHYGPPWQTLFGPAVPWKAEQS
ncbi:MAG TPA: hypothetical protein VMU17_06020 [Elusimicrobiota bacterium]|nr:hypothetical protein [Elusimicrobiota bacterium]